MLRVKICGLTRVEDIIWANSLMPDYVGFVFAPSRRKITVDTALMISKSLDHSIAKVGVFVNPSRNEIKEIVKAVGIDIVQLHGDEPPAFCDDLPFSIWKAFRIASDDDFKLIREYEGIISAAILDEFDGQSFGGTGHSFNWHLAAGKKFSMPIVLAGGLNCINLERAYRVVKPDIVDVSSGVEKDGSKDASKVAEFIERAKNLKS